MEMGKNLSHVHLSTPQSEFSPVSWALTTLFSGFQRVRPWKGKDYMMVEGFLSLS